MSEIKFNDKCVHVVFLGVPNVPGIAAEIFTTLSQHSVSVNMVTQNTMRGGRSDLSFLIDKEKLDEIIPVCREISEKIEGQGVSFATEVAAITVNLKSPENSAKTLAKIFKALASVNVNIEIINTTSESAIFIVSLTKAHEGLKELRETLGEN
ncbi:MAG: ACT domain-containing protein [Synergistaceae bacterium]|nr:ACT domain-containing protein [Synergistaceae bacterium]MBQ6435004.1 ACT domain-containing protein [Synergistaceae bacterium]MBQ6738120.1 ACT domain-containing protein [Synergistaceae bacterium]MBQ7069383.1 ACT domain-containing protein [Synergistaceae bacterium]MBR0074559.1 ACT domain-containing protein [Synergistaceae bacterium]